MMVNPNAVSKTVCAPGTDTPNYVLESSLVEATPDAQQAECYEALQVEESDDELERWYPMLIRHSNPKKARRLRDTLTKRGLSTYLRLQYSEVIIDEALQTVSAPALSNLIFVHTRKKILRYLKNSVEDLLSLQFMTVPKKDRYEKATIITVRDRDMANFISTETRPDPLQQRVALEYKDYIGKQGRRVRIIRGAFAGIEGEVKHIRGHRVIVVKLKDMGLATGITYVKPQDMEFIEDE